MPKETQPGDLQTLALAKRMLRGRVRAARSAIGPTVAGAAGDAIVAHWAGEPRVAAARQVLLYAAHRGELPTRPLFEYLRGCGVETLFPRCGERTLHFGRVEAWSELSPGRYGVLEPPAGAPRAELAPGAPVLVPGVAFDREGRRLGQGHGWYDRTFDASDRGRLIGAGFALQVVASVPVGPDDRGVGALLTERALTWVVRTE